MITYKMKSQILALLAAIIIASFSYANAAPTVEEYLKKRNQVLQNERSVGLGSNQVLVDAREVRVNEILMDLKGREYREGVDSNGVHFATAGHFFNTKPMIEASPVFKIIKMLPKGASLHLHDNGVPDMNFVIKNLTYMDNLYYCVDSSDLVTFNFFFNPPTEDCVVGRKWELVSDLRNRSSSAEFVDSWFYQSFTLVTPDPRVAYPDIGAAWRAFDQRFETLAGVTKYLPTMRMVYRENLQEMYDDNIMYVEERGLLSDIYRSDHSVLTATEALSELAQVAQEFKRDHPDFFGARYIYAPHRFHSTQEISQIIQEAVQMKAQHPDFFAGFDLVGQEGTGTPLLGYLPELLNASAQGINFFFHAGETAWHGTKIDENLFDALLLNTTRIGHGYALASHPLLAEEVKRRGIGVEVCPISNQVLRLVDDFRNHPIIPLMTEGFPMVIAADDPGIWGSKGLSYDWYIAFMAMAGGRTDLKFLKQLAINSLIYSAMTPSEKTAALTMWERKWSEFLDKVITLYDPDFLLQGSNNVENHDEFAP